MANLAPFIVDNEQEIARAGLADRERSQTIGFEVALDALEEFAVDYLDHNLRIKVRGGRTYNFTDRTANADALFVFHREVEEARERLGRGEPPALP